jgi:signal transduction histidine kinase
LGLYHLSQRPKLPLQIQPNKNTLIIANDLRDDLDKIPAKSTIFSVEFTRVRSLGILDEIIDRKNIGDLAAVQLSTGQIYSLPLIQRNDFWYLLLNGIIAMSFIIIGGLVWRGRKLDTDLYFALTALLFGFIIAMGWPGIKLPTIVASLLVVIYYLSYPQAFLIFLYFSYQFPELTISEENLRKRKIVLQIAGNLLSAILIILFFQKYVNFSLANIESYHSVYRLFRVFIFLTFLFSLYIIYRNFRRAPNPVSRSKVQWVLWGVFWGSFPYFFLWNLPQIFSLPPIIPEWLFIICLLLTPVGIAIAILRYRLFDIEIVLSRSLVYSFVIICLIAIYMISVGGLSLLIYHQFSLQSPLFSIPAVLIVALIFNPLKNNVQNFVNQKFFRIRYHRFKSLQIFMTDLEACHNDLEVLTQLENHFQNSIPVQKNQFLVRKNHKWCEFSSQKIMEKSFQNQLKMDFTDFKNMVILNSKLLEKVESHLSYPVRDFPKPWLLMVPLGEHMVWLLGGKRAGTKFWKEDLELVQQMSKSACLQIEKLEAIQKSIMEAVEKEQAQKLSEWKTILVSEVAHDLRSPLNTILWKLKNLQNAFTRSENVSAQPIEDILQQIYRLQKLIESLLVYADMDKGKLNLRLESINLKREIEEVLRNLQAIISQKQLKISLNCDGQLSIRSDSTLFQEILLNLIQNAAKFSPNGSPIDIQVDKTTTGKRENLWIGIKDQAGGIPKEKMKRIFEPFEDKKDSKDMEKGFHLGLYMVHEFTKLLNGKVKVESEMGKGTTVKLQFPFSTDN